MAGSGNRLTGLALAAGAVLAFSIRPLLIKLSYAHGAEPVTLLALRMGLSLPFFLAMGLWAQRDRKAAPVSPRDVALICGLGFLGYYLASFLDFMGLQYVTAGTGRLILFAYPTIVVLLSALFLKRPITARAVLALALTYGGIALVVAQASTGENRDFTLGAALVFGSSAAYAVYLVAGSDVVRRVGSMRFTAWATTVACAFCLAQFLAIRPLSALQLPGVVYLMAAVMATVCTVLPIFMTAEALRRVGANSVAVLGALGPVAAIGMDSVFMGEMLSTVQAAGAVLVLAGVLLVSLKPAR
ncbi:DMT family transporter [Arenibaculum pallidiluteum]|uniref:DMT family transporter n=1 Tax=Arenibaculum pallidiluteum TaxID=2812559 RepID=UPI001A96B119|nr:DMT family transporter [Arenibaculum pallidiluteum]